MDMTGEEQELYMEAWNRAIQPIVDVMQRVWDGISSAVQTVVKVLHRAGALPYSKHTRRPKRRSRLRSRVALKRKGLWATSVWA